MNNLSDGPILVAGLTIAEVNQALLALQERLDTQTGLRGRAKVWDRLRIDDGTEDSDAITRGMIQTPTLVTTVPFFVAPVTPIVARAPGTTYVELAATLRQQVSFAGSAIGIEARVSVQGWGTQSGAGKGVAITKADGTVVAQVTWDGNAEGLQTGAFTAVTLSTDETLQVRVKGSAATENLLLRSVLLNIQITVNVIPAL